MRRHTFPALADLGGHERALRAAAAAAPLAGENFAFLRAQIRDIREALPPRFCRLLPVSQALRVPDGRSAGRVGQVSGPAPGVHARPGGPGGRPQTRTSAPPEGSPRVYLLAREFLAAGGSELDLERATAFADAAQQHAPLTLAEVWAFFPMLKLALIEDLRKAAESGCDEDLRSAFAGLKELETAQARDFVESVSLVERELRRDPAGIYAKTAFETRDACRHAVETIARGSRMAEWDVAALAVELAASGPDRHVGYFLIGEGREELKRRAGYRAPFGATWRQPIERHPAAFYLGAIAALTALVMLAAFRALAPAPLWLLFLLAIPASQAAMAAVNPLVSRILSPRRLPRMDFSHGIPSDCRTFVVTPALLLSRQTAERLLERMEIHYLANNDPNLLFALLTDFSDAPQRTQPQDEGLLRFCVERIERLNQRYAGSPFYLFHRDREWSESESVWMGPERKRGKLCDFNRLLLGEADAFSTKAGDLGRIGFVRYVITLDADTQLPRDTAQKLVATLAHPLNRAVADPETRVVGKGYTIVQPRITVSMESASRSRLASLYSGQTGFDPYTTAVSDVYQDLFGQATYTGKGIYDVRAFEAALGGRFPDSTLLSHDLIEGEYTRTALATDIELIDDYPATYLAYSKRKHRWTRGDWQILPWLAGRVPVPGGKTEPNPLPLLSRWKIADNLRRSLIEISLALVLLAGWFLTPGAAFRATLTVAALLAAPAWFEFAWTAARVPPRRFVATHLREAARALARGHADALINLVFLGFQAVLSADAITRTIARVFFTRRKLLEWETMAQAEESSSRKGVIEAYLFAPVLFALAAGFLMPSARWHDVAGVAVLEMWIVSPLVALWLNRPPRRRDPLAAGDAQFLREHALGAWRYFAELSGPEHNWLIPDNVQEDPPRTAARTSPTNIGLLLASNLAAYDFGYLTRTEVTARLELSFDTLARLERSNGHFYNWYDTATLAPLEPLYVSTVDSGNLAAALLTVKQGCLECLREPVLGTALLEGLKDHCARLDKALPHRARSSSIARTLNSLERQVRYRPHDLFAWESALTEARAIALRLGKHLEWACSRLDAAQSAEIDRWHGLLMERLDTALAELYAFAPWLESPFEQELRVSSREPALAKLMAALERPVPFSRLPQQYDLIRLEIENALPFCRPALGRTLENLLPGVDRARARAEQVGRTLFRTAAAAGRFVHEMDFAFLFDKKAKQLRVGYDAGAHRLDAAHYGLLASEGRTAVFLAIAKRDAPHEAWFRLGRRLTQSEGSRTLLSWSGTMFEYLMPCLFMRTHQGTVVGESLKGIVRIQQAYARAHGVPWGISEAAYSARDGERNYQYRAFGVPGAALARDTGGLVVAPYASMLALAVDPRGAAANLRAMAAKGWLGRYGFFEAIDFTPSRPAKRGEYEVVRAFMAHHQGMSLLALANALLDEPMRRRFHADPLVQSAEFLLQERVPAVIEVESEPDLALPETGAAAA